MDDQTPGSMLTPNPHAYFREAARVLEVIAVPRWPARDGELYWDIGELAQMWFGDFDARHLLATIAEAVGMAEQDRVAVGRFTLDFQRALDGDDIFRAGSIRGLSYAKWRDVHSRACNALDAMANTVAHWDQGEAEAMRAIVAQGRSLASSRPAPENARTARRFAPFGTTIFAEMTALAQKFGAVNLGQGFPDFDGPLFVKEAAIEALTKHHNQYAPMGGVPELTETLARLWMDETNIACDAKRHVTVTAGCTEAIAAAMLGLVNPGDEVILFEPYYDSYRACVAMAGGVPRFVTLNAPEFRFDRAALASAFTEKTKLILVNTPHNPTGRVFTREELATIAELCVAHDVLALTDEVYERLVFDGEHLRLATFPGMAERTLTMSSLGKTFSLTGWKIGWAIGPEEMTRAIRAAHQFLTFAVATPLQRAAAAALGAAPSYYDALRSSFKAKRDVLCDALEVIGFDVRRPEGGYFVMADFRSIDMERLGLPTDGSVDDAMFCKALVERVGVAAIPPSFFYEHKREGATMARFAFCKQDETIGEGVRRLNALKR